MRAQASTTGPVSSRREGDASSEPKKEIRDDEMLPGLVGAVRQAFVALVEKQCDIVFDEVDHDSNGRLSSAELHVAILLAYGRINQILGHMALKAPCAREVKSLLAASDIGHDGTLTRDEFKDVFVRKFMRQVAAEATARLVTQKLLIPAGGVGLNLLVDHWRLGKRLEAALNRHSGWTGPKGMVVRSVRRTVTGTVLSQLGRALGPMVNMQIAAAVAAGARVEDAIESWLRRNKIEEPGR